MRFGFFVLLLFLAIQPASARLYKWVDEAGNVHYSDKLPPSAIRKAPRKTRQPGPGHRGTGRAKTPEEIAREEELRRLREKQQRQLEEQKAVTRYC